MPITPFEQLSIRVRDGKLEVLDQTKLPDHEDWIHADTVETMWQLIKQLSVRGAPLIGVAAALSLAVKAQQGNLNLV
jgi:methylthioribose-1-phosphate isomerase